MAAMLKRRTFIAIATIIAIAAFGALLQNPPSLIDAITGATRKSRPLILSVAPKSYTLAVNPERFKISDIEAALSGQGSYDGAEIQLSILEGIFTERKSDEISESLSVAGFNPKVNAYSETMLFSRAIAGKYDLLLYPADDTAPSIPGALRIEVPE
jgi:hypothetical protein